MPSSNAPLAPATDAPRPGAGVRPRRHRRLRRPAVRAAKNPIDPIRSGARGGTDQEMFLEDGPIGYTPRPANLGGVRCSLRDLHGRRQHGAAL